VRPSPLVMQLTIAVIGNAAYHSSEVGLSPWELQPTVPYVTVIWE